VVGKHSFNLIVDPAASTPLHAGEVASALVRLIQHVLPNTVHVPLTLATLNSLHFLPVKNYDRERLDAAIFQLVYVFSVLPFLYILSSHFSGGCCVCCLFFGGCMVDWLVCVCVCLYVCFGSHTHGVVIVCVCVCVCLWFLCFFFSSLTAHIDACSQLRQSSPLG
jgi:Mini-chromosome maintenance replisome factor